MKYDKCELCRWPKPVVDKSNRKTYKVVCYRSRLTFACIQINNT